MIKIYLLQLHICIYIYNYHELSFREFLVENHRNARETAGILSTLAGQGPAVPRFGEGKFKDDLNDINPYNVRPPR